MGVEEILEMTALTVCAVIVTHHPSIEMIENVPKILAQVHGLVIVDNGSKADEIDSLRVASPTLGFHLIENVENLGVAEALNQGVRWAKSAGYPWAIFFDQDSGITDDFVCQMFAAWESHPDRERVGSIHPRYVDPQTGIEAAVPRASDGTPVLPMTSGSLMPAWIFDEIGWFASEYFIDLVDWEYSFRIRAAGYLSRRRKTGSLTSRSGQSLDIPHFGLRFPYHPSQPTQTLLHCTKFHCFLPKILFPVSPVDFKGYLSATARHDIVLSRRRGPSA